MEITRDKFWLTINDHSVSGDSFDLFYNSEFDMLVTYPQPEPALLPTYYDSEDYISHTDSKRSVFEKIYHVVKNISIKSKVKLINLEAASKGNLLDIGAGTGDFLAFANSKGWNTLGIEPNDKARNIAISKGVAFKSDTKDIPDASFDVITMWHVLEHVPDLDNQLGELRRLLKPNGTLVIAVPNFKSFDAKHYGKFWAAYDVPRHLWHFSKRSIELLGAGHGLQLRKILPMKYDAFYVSMLSEKYKTGKVNFVTAILIGLKSNLFGLRKKEYSSHIYILKYTQNGL